MFDVVVGPEALQDANAFCSVRWCFVRHVIAVVVCCQASELEMLCCAVIHVRTVSYHFSQRILSMWARDVGQDVLDS